MKMGISTYSLHRAMQAGEMSLLDVIDWIAANGGEHVEIAAYDFLPGKDDELVDAVKDKAASAGIAISNYAIGANFLTADEASYQLEIERVKKQVDIADRLGVKLMRHDVAYRAPDQAGMADYMNDLPRLAQACQAIADHASQYGIVTSVENHGFYVQASDRVQALVHATNRANFKTTLDVGNFWCADEEPLTGLRNNLPIASMVHLKDFYHRSATRSNPGAGWFQSSGGAFLRGAIVGQGDIDMEQAIGLIKRSGYDGFISIEFEGIEECKASSKAGMDFAKRVWDELA